jgi:two-component system response regulator DesR
MAAPSRSVMLAGMRVLLADREGAVRNSIEDVLRRLASVSCVGVVGSRDDLASAVRRTRPDVLVIDDRLLAAGDHVLVRSGPLAKPLRVIVVGVIDEPAFAARALRLGAEAWIAKDRADEELAQLMSQP